MSMSYNGWSNYETWCVALWIGNEEGSYRESVAMTRAADDEDRLANELREWVESTMPDLGASMWSDLLRSAFSEVDWYEIAASYWADYREEQEAEA